MSESATVPERCPRCGLLTELAHAEHVFDGQRAAWWRFANGSRVIAPPHLPTPRRCAVCRVGWVIEPGTGRLVPVMC